MEVDKKLKIDHGIGNHKMRRNIELGRGYFGPEYKGEKVVTFGWVLQINTFIRSISMLAIVHTQIRQLPFCCACLAALFGFMAVTLIIYRPYNDMLITILEAMFMTMLALICYA